MRVPPSGTKVLLNLTVVTLKTRLSLSPCGSARARLRTSCEAQSSPSCKSISLSLRSLCPCYYAKRTTPRDAEKREGDRLVGRRRKKEREKDTGGRGGQEADPAKGGMARGESGREATKLTAAVVDVWLMEWCSDARGHTYANCSFVVAARAAVHQSPWTVSSDHWDTSYNQIKHSPRNHMQDDRQLPRAPPASTYSICFSSPPAITGPRLSVRDLGFRGSDSCQMSSGVCAARIFLPDILL